MLASTFVYRLAFAVAACLPLIAPPRLPAQDAELPESIRLAHVRYADLTPLAVAWTQTTKVNPRAREKIAASDGSSVQQLAFREGRIYLRRETQGDSSWPPRTEETAFDRNLLSSAKNLYYASVPGKDAKDRPYLHKWLPKNDDPQASYFQEDYFRAAGVRLPARTRDVVQSWHPQSELLALLAEGGRVEPASSIDLDGRSFIRVPVTSRTSQEKNFLLRRYDFYLDPERGYAIRRFEIRDESGRLLIRCDCTEFEQLSGRLIWMPRRCRVEEYASTETQDKENRISDNFSSPLYEKTIQVNAFDVQPWPDERFHIQYTTPGVYVNDASFPEMTGKDGIFYQIPANPQRIEEVIALRRAFYQAWRKAEKKSRPLRVVFLVLNGVGLAGVAVYFFVRRRRKGVR